MFFKFARFVVLIICKIIFRLEIIGHENIPKEGGVIICSNHRSYWDPPFVVVSMKRKPILLAKKELFDVPILKTIIKYLGAIPLDREKLDFRTFRTTAKKIAKGELLVIFPEGSRKKEDGAELKSGVSLLARESKATVIPTYIKGEYKLFRKMKIKYGKAIDLDEYYDKKMTKESLAEMTEIIAKSIFELEGEM